MAECSLCRPDLGPQLAVSPTWQLILNHNQNLLGKCFLSLNRHLESVTELNIEEWTDLQVQLRRATHMLTAAFQPDHFNYAFLQNQDRHVHMHLIPRYVASRTFADGDFADPDYPSHYAVPSPVRRLDDARLNELAGYLRGHLD